MRFVFVCFLDIQNRIIHAVIEMQKFGFEIYGQEFDVFSFWKESNGDQFEINKYKENLETEEIKKDGSFV